MKVGSSCARLVLCVVLASSSLIGQKNYDELSQKLGAALDAICSKNEFPGMTMSVVLPDNHMIELASGYAFPEDHVPMKPRDRMLAGSTGKTFVAAVLLQLVSEGRLRLDDNVGKYLGKYEWFKRIPNHADLTIDMLSHHTGGLPRYIFVKQFSQKLLASPEKVWKPVELLSYVFDAPPAHPAGRGWFYSDTDYILIGMIIEEVAGNTLYSEVSKRVLQPLHLVDIAPSDNRVLKDLVQGLSGTNEIINSPDKVLNGRKYFINPQFEWAGGGFIANAPDLARWARALYGGRLLGREAMDLLLSTVSMKTGRPDSVGYGIAVMRFKTSLGDKYTHTGLMPGYETEMAYFKDHDIAIALQVNQDDFQGKPKHLPQYSFDLTKIVVDYLASQK